MISSTTITSQARELAARISHLRRHSVVRNTLWLYLVQFSGYLLPMITLPYLSRVLSVEKFGLIAYAQSLMWNFTTLTEYGFNITATREVSINRERPEALARVFSKILVAKGLLTLIGFLALTAMIAFVPRFRQDGTLFLISFLSVVGYWLFPVWLYQGLEMMKQVAVRDFLAKLASLLLLLGIVRGDEQYLWAAAAPAAGLVVAGVIGLIWVPILTSARFVRPTWAEVWEALLTGWPPFLTTAANSLSYTLNVVLLGAKGYTREIGFFNAAFRICSVPRGLIAPLSTSLYSHLSYKASSEETSIQFVKKNRNLLSLPFLAMSLGMMAVGPWLIPIVLGRKYQPAIPAFEILALGVFVLALSHVYSTYYMLPCGHDKAWARIVLIALALNTLLLWPLLWVTSASVALSLTLTSVDATATAGYWMFFRKRVRALGLQ